MNPNSNTLSFGGGGILPTFGASPIGGGMGGGLGGGISTGQPSLQLQQQQQQQQQQQNPLLGQGAPTLTLGQPQTSIATGSISSGFGQPLQQLQPQQQQQQLQLQQQLTTNLPTDNINKNIGASLTTTTSTTQSVGLNPPAGQMNFSQLEEHINKWTLTLEEQEKMFLNQATQVNSWDKVLISNNQKIINLSESVEKVKIDQQTLEHELEFIAAQHCELDECITPLQNELAKTQHLDADKAQTYILAENLDTQLRQMSEDLKEVIEHLNEANKVQDTTDPIVRIGLILNAHMSSLQWIESQVGQVSHKIEDISKMYDSVRRDNERSMRLTYE